MYIIRLIILITISLVLEGCFKEQPLVPISELITRDGIKYHLLEKKPFSGTAFENFQSGTPKIIVSYSSGISNGIEEHFHENGQLAKRINWGGAKSIGHQETFYDDGSLSSTVNLLNGNKDGKLISYYQDGIIRNEIDYKDGQMHGSYASYAFNGSLIENTFYKNNIKDGFSDHYLKGILWFRNHFVEGIAEGLFEQYNTKDGTLMYSFVVKGDEATEFYVDKSFKKESADFKLLQMNMAPVIQGIPIDLSNLTYPN